MKFLSKSDYVLYRECPHNAWVKKWKPDVYYASPLSDFEMHLITAGNMVEEKARERFSGGVLIETSGEESLDETKELLKNTTEIIYQASFSDGTLFAAVDILKQNENGELSIYEVKASSVSKLNQFETDDNTDEEDEVVDFKDQKALEKYKKKLLKDHHLYDLAFQVFLARKVGHKVTGAYLVRLNKQYVRAGNIELKKLFVVEDVIPYIEEILPIIEEEIKIMTTILSSEKEPSSPCCCIYKGRSKHCTTFSEHNKAVPKYSVHDLTAIGKSKRRLQELIDSGVYDILNIPDDFEFGKKIEKQVKVHKRGKAEIDHQAIHAELETLKFPLYFLDYESFNPAIPRFSGYKPYQQIPFQFSIHRLDSQNAEPICEKGFLYTGKEDPSQMFLEELQKQIGKIGSIVVWNRTFEESHVNKHLAIRIPESAEFIKDLNSRIFDLMTIFSKQLHIHPDFHGSASIKKVLPVLSNLSYQELDIGNGSEAMNTWNKLATEDISNEERKKTEEAMLKYCQLDTYAMYAILKHLYEMV